MAILTDTFEDLHFDPEEFDDLIEQHGVDVVWRRARSCPCIKVDRGQPAVNCPYCTVIPGRIYDAGEPVRVFAPSRERKDNADEAGSWRQGFINITFKSVQTPGHEDLVEFQQGELVANEEFHVRAKNTPDGVSTERLRLRPVRVEFFEAIVGGNLVQYELLTDFMVDPATGVITWGGGPPDGTRYSVRYVARPTFIVWSPMSRDEGGNKMPYRVHAQRLDFFDQTRAPAP